MHGYSVDFVRNTCQGSSCRHPPLQTIEICNIWGLIVQAAVSQIGAMTDLGWNQGDSRTKDFSYQLTSLIREVAP